MVITILEAHVPEGREGDLERAYRNGIAEIPPDIVQTFLVRDTRDDSMFRIMTLWINREALDVVRASGITPAGVLMFEAAGATPTLSIFDVVVHGVQGVNKST